MAQAQVPTHLSRDLSCRDQRYHSRNHTIRAPAGRLSNILLCCAMHASLRAAAAAAAARCCLGGARAPPRCRPLSGRRRPRITRTPKPSEGSTTQKMTRFGAAAARSPHHTIEAPAAQHFAASLPLPGPRAVARRARPWLCPYARASPGTTRTISTSPEAHHDPRSNNREHVLQPPTPFALSTLATTAPPPPRLCARACPLHLLPPTIAPSLPLSGPPSAMGLPVDTRPSRTLR